LNFIKFGKNGLAAGVLNAAASFGLVLQYCVFGSVADHFGWNVVTALWVIMIFVAIICNAFAVGPAKKFKKSVNE
jgi:sugar phosphate permease